MRISLIVAISLTIKFGLGCRTCPLKVLETENVSKLTLITLHTPVAWINKSPIVRYDSGTRVEWNRVEKPDIAKKRATCVTSREWSGLETTATRHTGNKSDNCSRPAKVLSRIVRVGDAVCVLSHNYYPYNMRHIERKCTFST